MTDREKVIAAYICYNEKLPDKRCEKCPYGYEYLDQTGDNYFVWCNIERIMVDAIDLLKAQEPRVMTLEKTQTALHNDDVVWVEIKDKIIYGGIRMDGTDYFTMQNGDVLDVTDFDSGEGAEMYGREVRCWTSRPTDAQREAVKWE